ncbi:DUF3592 domain-containing protein [Nonomuraea sp. NPDC050556]|uniref:DUF3592 domain-containing protein n=1 Tax=Nonomuraea sp. NPDC050556 TaxID=3364369 RepID=UPI0037BB49D5
MGYVYCGLVLVLGVFAAVLGRRRTRGGLHLLRSGIRVLGTAIDLTLASADDTRKPNHHVTLKFVTRDGQAWVTRSPVLMRAEHVRLGVEITVIYDRADPRNVRIASWPGLGIGGGQFVYLLGVTLTIVALVGALVILLG